MSSVAQNVRDGLLELGGRDGLTKERIAIAARRAGLSVTRCWDIWYGKARKIGADEAVKILAAVEKRNHQALREVASVAAEYEALAKRLENVDPDFHRVEIDALRALAFRARRQIDRKE